MTHSRFASSFGDAGMADSCKQIHKSTQHSKGSATLAQLHNDIVTFPSSTIDFNIATQGLTLAMCPLARTHFLGGRASSGHNN